MIYGNLIFFISLFSIIHLIYYVTALNHDGIVGGYYAPPDTFTYQVSIQISDNFSALFTPICGGGIIDNYFIVSAAHCFTDISGALQNKSFSVVAGSIDLMNSTYIRRSVTYVYLPGLEREFNNFDVAVVQLLYSLDISRNPSLSKLQLPILDEGFNGMVGEIAGYGFDWARTGRSDFSERVLRIHGGTQYLLKFAFVKVARDVWCNKYYPMVSVTQMCGIMLTHPPNLPWGNCEGDSGNPLVINNIFAGIVIRYPADCNESAKGGIYIRISYFANFIRHILNGGNNWNSTIIYPTQPHLLF